MTTRLESYFSMTYNLGESDSFAKRHVARRFAAFPLIGIEVSELVSHIFHAPTDGCAKLSIMCGKKIFSGSPEETWEKHWKPLETLKKVALLFIALLATLLIGWWAPTWNHTIHEKLGLINPKVAPVVIPPVIPVPTPVTPSAASTPAKQTMLIHLKKPAVVTPPSVIIDIPPAKPAVTVTPLIAPITTSSLISDAALSTSSTDSTTTTTSVSSTPASNPTPPTPTIATVIANPTIVQTHFPSQSQSEPAQSSEPAPALDSSIVSLAPDLVNTLPSDATGSTAPTPAAVAAAATPVTPKKDEPPKSGFWSSIWGSSAPATSNSK